MVQGFMEHGACSPEFLPRNINQVYNIQAKLNLKQKHDSFYEVYLWALQYPELILKIELFPYVTIVQQHPETTKHIRSLGGLIDPIVYHYDTTFNVGKFFTSILTVRHSLFKGSPLIQVAVMYHETTAESAHDTFFEMVAGRLNLNSQNTVIVTDRERSIINAIRKHLPDATKLYCWNHLQKVIFSISFSYFA